MNRTEFFKLVKKHITVVREQGSMPSIDLNNFSLSRDRYICDLCKQSLMISGLTQCGLCGRWICKKGCWDEKYSVCNNCAGVVKLIKESFLIAKVVEESSKWESMKEDILGKLGLKKQSTIRKSNEQSLMKEEK